MQERHLLVAREALAFARAQLPTREEVARIGYEAYAKTWVESPGAEKFKALMASSWDTASAEVHGFWLAVADALLRDLTARLGG